jgi:hypothetical protein
MPSNVTRAEFASWWDALNVEFPPYKLSAAELGKQAHRWFFELERCSLDALDDSFREWCRQSDRRPHLNNILAGCGAYNRRRLDVLNRESQQTRIAPDSNHCECGCAGVRWAKVMLDAVGQPRRYGTSPEAFGAPLLRPDISGPVTSLVLALSGDYVTRDFLECVRSGSNLQPVTDGERLGLDERGVMVWLLRPQPLAGAA